MQVVEQGGTRYVLLPRSVMWDPAPVVCCAGGMGGGCLTARSSRSPESPSRGGNSFVWVGRVTCLAVEIAPGFA